MSESDDLETFARELPKTETHLHIEGALTWEQVHAVDPDRFPEPFASTAPAFRFPDFAAFNEQILGAAGTYFTSPERYHEHAQKVFADLLAQNVAYIETSFASGVAEFMGYPLKEVLHAIRAAVPKGLTVKLIVGIHHSGYSEKMAPVLLEAVDWDELDGVDLHGDEDESFGEDPAWVPMLWQRFRDAGKLAKAHAGEFGAPEMIEWAVRELGVRRIEHGVQALKSPDTLAMLRENDITLDVCPTSNLKLQCLDAGHAEPIHELVNAGIRCTVNTDDPGIFGCSLTGEYVDLARSEHFTRAELVRLARHGFEIALLPEKERQTYLAELDRIAASLPPER